VAVLDARDAVVAGAPDLVRTSLGAASGARLRATASFAADLDPADLRAREGPPGSACLRLWVTSSPPNMAADFLVCVTAKDSKSLRATVLREDLDGQPDRVAEATVSRRGKRVLVIGFSQAAIGSPKRLRFATEATEAGCARQTCVDVAPDAPRTVSLRVR